jgi:hypothetical protein
MPGALAADLSEAGIVADRSEVLVVASRLGETRVESDCTSPMPERGVSLTEERLGAGEVEERPR